ncbi:MAG TPA: cation diffusion facilitator family transporter [Anaeromyxobacteraceae bacterium]|nr:cation diffusion facilitator family transporter [Anaeromyxobacteraceae bacterium]
MTTTAQPNLTRFAWLSIAAAIATIALKTAAWWLTGSVGLLSDAAESVVNLMAAAMTLMMLGVAARPPDEDHAWGHTKAEYFASAVEGGLILVAAAAIAWTGVDRLLHPRPIEQAGIGLAISTGASLVNFAVSRVLFRAGKRYHSIALEADAHHLMTDVWTSAGVLAGIGVVAVTGWQRLDPIVALLVAANIVWTGVQLIQRSTSGLLDIAITQEEQQTLQAILARYAERGVQFHAVRTRQAAARRFITMHVLVPGDWTVRRGHDLAEEIEQAICAVIPNANVMTHLEAVEDPASFADQGLDRAVPGPAEAGAPTPPAP